jgi:hypothetical protein
MDTTVRTAQRTYGEIVARALTDPDFRARLEADPRGVLDAAGMPLPPDMRIVVVDAAPSGAPEPGVLPIVIAPPDEELSSDDLAAVAGGIEAGSLFTILTAPSCIGTYSTIVN